jgi:hypothetical protein
MDVVATIEAPVGVEKLFSVVADLATYPQWLGIVHQVTAELDHGQILAQVVVPVLPGDSPQALAARVLEQEHLLYPQAVRDLLPHLPPCA